MNLVELAQRISTLRLDRRLTLEEVASHTGLTRSWLSEVENFRVTPSLPALAQIAAVLGLTTVELVEGLDEKPQLVIVRKNERQIVERDKSSKNTPIYESLAHKRPNRAMDPFMLTVPPAVAREQPLAHESEEIMVGGWKDRGIIFTVGTNASADWLYQDQVWWCIWYARGNRGGTRLLKLGDSVMAVYHWMGAKNAARTEVRAQLIRRAVGPVSARKKPNGKQKPVAKWRMAEAYQLPHIPAAPAGILIKTLLKLRSGDWTCLGYIGSQKGRHGVRLCANGRVRA